VAKKKRQSKRRSLSTEVVLGVDNLENYYKSMFVSVSGFHYPANNSSDGFQDARDAIGANMEVNFTNLLDDFLQKLSSSRSNDEAFFEKISGVIATLSAPLSEEQIETTFSRDEKQITEIARIGNRVELFKRNIEKASAKLRDCWTQWEEMQSGFIDLGVEVFGYEAFGVEEDNDGESKKGYKTEMELLDLEYNTRMEELTEEIEDLRARALQKTKSSEKVH